MKRKPLPAKSKFSAFIELTKPRITILILISTALGYYLAESAMINYLNFFYTILGTAILSGGAGTINHCIERDLDMLMDRTKSRPIPTGLISIKTALNFGLAQSIIGLAILWVFVNQLTATLGLATILLYLFVYTPLKKITWLNTTIGAIPGAMPALGGWAASANELSPNAWILFAILFLWQHPHFYAIAIMCKDDYERAGFKMLPVIEKENHRTNRQIIWHAFLLIPVSLYFVVTGALGIFYFWGALLLGIVYLISSIPLLIEAVDVSSLPLVNALLNLTTTILLIIGYVLIKLKKREMHRSVMLTAFFSSALFLVSYVIYHWFKSGPKAYTGEWISVYYPILVTHIILAMIILPLAMITLYRGWVFQIQQHRKIARITLPIWLYVSVTGIIIYLMLYT